MTHDTLATLDFSRWDEPRIGSTRWSARQSGDGSENGARMPTDDRLPA